MDSIHLWNTSKPHLCLKFKHNFHFYALALNQSQFKDLLNWHKNLRIVNDNQDKL